MPDEPWQWRETHARKALHCAYCGMWIHEGHLFWLGSQRRVGRAFRHRFVCQECGLRRTWQVEQDAARSDR